MAGRRSWIGPIVSLIDEIRLRAHARPLDETPGDIAT
jgi:hypothetical protein